MLNLNFSLSLYIYIYGKSTDFHTKKELIFVEKLARETTIFVFVFLYNIDQSVLTRS